MAASWYGKAKTVTQICAIVLFIIKDSWFVESWGDAAFFGFYVFSWLVMFAAIVLTVVSMLDYFAKASDLLGFTRAKKGAGAGCGAPLPDAAGETGCEEDPYGDIEYLAQHTIEHALATGARIATAESCTGGMIAAALTSVPGSSAVVAGGIVSYTNQVKAAQLGVDSNVLARFGAVSEEVAKQMAEGARKRLEVDCAVSVTGIAGPGGVEVGKPVGTVWIGFSDDRFTYAKLFHFDGDRAAVRCRAAIEALGIVDASLTA